ncbi:MAG: hypothetical protein IT305_13625 [Chloroflexi bacterium]|nr:hypothetical protein [Chloroflexota bacterium]
MENEIARHGEEPVQRPAAQYSSGQRPSAHEAATPPMAAQRQPPRCDATDEDEPMGGDPPCWQHLFEDGDAGELAPDRA